ncbi:flagellar hook protein FlgE [Aquabacterium sp.]|jgi:flagellar hook protein FlgE|uniref:flagellar hook protein FlgE n=1 Tax=Aquabacterium sp. TaxID=1872578 RepID=UPI002488E64B|nr:flagellar hook protein FlgE [Aquabacterium sp.]MDI1350647.1 flagellar hook protein FlgE [Aquabacterium sp.]
MGFQQGLSGLNTSSKSLEVIGNNVANANTYGAKSSRAEFADMYAASLGGGGSNGIGIGARIGAVAQQFTQGNITTTSNNLDLAINGRGFFAMQTAQGETVYTRNGQFKRDASGFIVNNEKHQLLGQALDDTGAPSGPAGSPIRLSNDGSPPQKASAVTLTANMDAKATIPAVAVDFANSKSYNFVTSQTAYGDNGAPVALNYYFRKVSDAVAANPSAIPPVAAAGSQWSVYLSADGNTNAASVNTVAGAPAPIATFTYNADGTLPAGTVFTIPSIPGGKNGQPLTGVTLDLSKSTEYAGNYAVTELSGGGYAQGNLSDFLIETDGTVKARYTNGQSKAIARVQLADFKNLNGLQPIGGNEWKATNASGEPLPLGAPGSGVYGLLQSGALEESNVDLTGELVNMIVAQRAYQANAQTIKTEDQVLQTLVNLR